MRHLESGGGRFWAPYWRDNRLEGVLFILSRK